LQRAWQFFSWQNASRKRNAFCFFALRLRHKFLRTVRRKFFPRGSALSQNFSAARVQIF